MAPRRKFICLHCEQEIELGKRVFLIPYEDYAPDAFLFAHPQCMPNLEGRENILDGYYVEGSEEVFVPCKMVEILKGTENSEGG